jgi:hypothetical protein
VPHISKYIKKYPLGFNSIWQYGQTTITSRLVTGHGGTQNKNKNKIKLMYMQQEN